ncbi:unnamed protein product [Leptosia nina]|uniref:Elongator complex protein 2 n=1 Tax=Leptosia nina TaxID=320188 RepID=A0AAV1JT30_9NEOP
MKIFVKQVYTAAACNRTPEIVDWNKAGLMCFGACNAVVIYDTKIKGRDPLAILAHHGGRVNSVKWLTKPDGTCNELISASADKTAVIWTLVDDVWKVTSVLKGHSDGITCVYGMYTGGNDLFVFTSSVDSTVKVWERSNDTVTLKQSINLNSGLCLTLHAQMLPVVNKPILFLGLDDNKIHVFALNGEYHRVDVLVGHEDWVRGLDSIIEDNNIMLASASQDTYIRIWRIERYVKESSPVTGIKVEQKVFDAYDVIWSVKLEAVLAGHEGWVYGVQWDSFSEKDNKQPIQRLLSSSLDKTIIIWEPEANGAWVEKIRVGEVGGNGLGFYGSRFGPGAFMGHGYNGSFHIWKLDKTLKTCESSLALSGHFSGVEDVQWEGRGRYLLSASMDQTARLHAPWKLGHGIVEWHEIARPQIHGYDMCSLAPIRAGVYASAAEEKVIRVFQAPNNFVTNFKNITSQELEMDDLGPEGASVPSLGLSNKAVFSGDDMTDADVDKDGYFTAIELHEPPTEETLMQNTLWPESHKLYGHGYEVFCVCASPDGTLLASSCKANTAQHAAVLIWDTKTWQQIHKLVSHQLTVTQLAFSPDSQHLLSVSRDRRWTLFKRDENSNKFEVAACTDKTNGVHSRIIWCCAWFSEGVGFGTGSRDGKVCLWSKTDSTSDTTLKNYALLGKPLELEISVTAIAFAPEKIKIVAVGLETGCIQIFKHEDSWTTLHQLDNSAAHHLTVKRLTFKPKTKEDNKHELLLASCGSDHFVRIHSINLDPTQT